MQDINEVYTKACQLLAKQSLNDATHRLDHTERVIKLAEYIVKKEKLERKASLENIKLAAVLHDLGQNSQIKALRKSNNKMVSGQHVQQSFSIAQKFL